MIVDDNGKGSALIETHTMNVIAVNVQLCIKCWEEVARNDLGFAERFFISCLRGIIFFTIENDVFDVNAHLGALRNVFLSEKFL